MQLSGRETSVNQRLRVGFKTVADSSVCGLVIFLLGHNGPMMAG